MAQLISKRYAEALFQLALEQDCVEKYNDEVKLICDCFKNDDEILKVLNHPEINSEKKMEIVSNCFKDFVSSDILGLFNIIFRKNREHELIEILDSFLKRVMEYKGIAKAIVESAVPLSEDNVNEIKEKLSIKLNKQVEVETRVLPELIGGLKISVCGFVFDNTVKNQLDGLKKALLEIKLA